MLGASLPMPPACRRGREIRVLRILSALAALLFARPGERRRCGLMLIALVAGIMEGRAADSARHDVQVLTIEGMTNEVLITRVAAGRMEPAFVRQILYPGDRGRTGPRSRATLRMSDLSVLRVSELSQFLIEQPPDPAEPAGLALFKGLLHLFHRDRPDTSRIRSRTAVAAIRGTELLVEVDEITDRLTLTLLEGEAELSNVSGTLSLKSGEQGIAEPGQPPRKTAVIVTRNLVQWCLYYAAVLDADELELGDAEAGVLAESLADYRAGDLFGALAGYPANRTPATAAEQVYLAALLLSVGQAEKAAALLQALPVVRSARVERLSAALRTLLTATIGPTTAVAPPEPDSSPPANRTASEWLADSYLRQAGFDLRGARQAAREAVALAPRFGFAWARLAELEFSFGDLRATRRALEQALAHSPRHAQAVALRGFVLAADNRIDQAYRTFQQAIGLDGGLGNAWLGRGLCRIRQGHVAEGREDIQIAAALEPNRALLRSYLGKAFHQAGDSRHATNELALAKQLDPGDPTAWLYSALVDQQDHQINEAVRGLERSIELNNGRGLYRSRLLLDQDRAVRQANLAAIYHDAGLPEVSVREAGRAVTDDYANHSAHLFLANSYAAQRDPNFLNLRYETAALSEYLLANLLAPAGAGTLSPYLAQQEYSRLFERDGFGLSAGAVYRSSGDWDLRAAQYGTFDGFGYALEAGQAHRDVERPNGELDLLAYSAAVKQQLSPRDMVFVQATVASLESGDVRQYYDPNSASSGLRIRETQQPNFYAGYRHEWWPGVQTLLLAARLEDDFRLHEPAASVLTLTKFNNMVTEVSLPEESAFDLSTRSEFVAGSAELQQIVQRGRHTVVAGARYQQGRTETSAQLDYVGVQPEDFPFPEDTQHVDTELVRATAYGYETWHVFDSWWFSGGLSFDWLRYPENIDLPPVTSRELEKSAWSPKAGVIWEPARGVRVRAAYTRSLGGLYYDQSVRLEPTQVAGFNQAFRSLIPESVAGLVPGTEFATWNLGYSQRLPSGTYLGLDGEVLESEGGRTVGVFERFLGDTALRRSGTFEHLDFRETSLSAYVHQLVGYGGSVGARYRLSEARLQSQMPELLSASNEPASANRDDTALLHHLSLTAQYAHSSGYFGGVQAGWWHQENQSHGDATPGDDFWQVDVQVGFRLPKRKAEIVVGLLNIFDQDYHLNPLNLQADLPRGRTLLVSLRVNL